MNQIYLAKPNFLNLLLPIPHYSLTLEISKDVPPPLFHTIIASMLYFRKKLDLWHVGGHPVLHWAVVGGRNAAGKGVFHDAQPDKTVPCHRSSDWECFHTVSSLVRGPKGTLKRVGTNS